MLSDGLNDPLADVRACPDSETDALTDKVPRADVRDCPVRATEMDGAKVPALRLAAWPVKESVTSGDDVANHSRLGAVL
jgi:hypothetical protein